MDRVVHRKQKPQAIREELFGLQTRVIGIKENYHTYLYGAKFDVVTDNTSNHLTYVFTTAKQDANGQTI